MNLEETLKRIEERSEKDMLLHAGEVPLIRALRRAIEQRNENASIAQLSKVYRDADDADLLAILTGETK